MRKVTEEALRQERLALSKLEEEWPRMSRATVSRELRDSLYTRINELRASVATMEAKMRKVSLRDGRGPAAEAA